MIKIIVIAALLIPNSVWNQTFAVIGDFGSGNENEEAVSELVDSWNPDLIITTGDNNYPFGSAETIDDHIGQFYSDYIFPYLGEYGEGAEENAFFPSLGNHDYFTEGAEPYLDYFTLPGNERYYDFQEGDVHFFALNSCEHEEDGVDENSTQALWLQETMSSSTATWKVVYLHLSPFGSGDHGSHPVLQWPYAEWGASIVFSGHDHIYELCFDDCIPYIVNGLGGASLDPLPSGIGETHNRFAGQYGALKVVASETELITELWTVDNELISTHVILVDENRIFPCPQVLASQPSGISHELFFDFNGDGKKDMFYLSLSDLYWVQNTGLGIFSEPIEIYSGLENITLLEPNDINEDGFMDILTFNQVSSEFRWLLGDGTGQVSGEISILEDSYIGMILPDHLSQVLRDIDHDGDLDMVWVEQGSSLRCNENLGNGSFNESIELIPIIGSDFQFFEIVDVNSDDFPDVVWMTSGVPNYKLNNSDLTFDQTAIPFSALPILEGENGVSLDVDADGDTDFVFSGVNSGTDLGGVLFYENDGFGVFGEVELVSSYEGELGVPVFSDLADDAGPHLWIPVLSDSERILQFELVNGVFDQYADIENAINSNFRVRDLDNDQFEDLIFSQNGTNGRRQIYWMKNEGSGNLQSPEVLVETSQILIDQPKFFDFNSDGDADMVVKTVSGFVNMLYYENMTISDYTAPGDLDGDGVIGSTDLTIFLSVFGQNCGVCPSDINGDGFVTSADLTDFLQVFGECY